jgi:hypothetical protein
MYIGEREECCREDDDITSVKTFLRSNIGTDVNDIERDFEFENDTQYDSIYSSQIMNQNSVAEKYFNNTPDNYFNITSEFKLINGSDEISEVLSCT